MTGNPENNQRWTRLARQLGWAWCAVSAILGLIATSGLAGTIISGKNKLGPGAIIYFLACFLVFGMPAILYLLLAILIPRRKTWVLVSGIVVASLHIAFAIVGFVGLIVYVAPAAGTFVIVPSGGAILYIAGCSHLIYVLSKCFGALHVLDDKSPRAFEPII